MRSASTWIVASSTRLLATLAALCLLGMLAIVSLDVAGRTFLNRPVPETLEIVTNVFMVGLVFLPLPMLEKMNGHISVETVTILLPGKYLRYVDAFVAVLTLGFYTIIAYAGVGRALHSTRIGESSLGTTFDVPVWPARWMVVICFLVAALVVAKRILLEDKATDK